MSGNSNRLFELDALRGSAALLVVIYHFFYRYNELYGHPDLDVSWARLDFGVQFFFIISGFVIYWTLQRIQNPADFIVSRFSRLYPAFWTAALITFLVVSLVGLPGREVSLQSAIANALMFHEYFGVAHIDGVYWSLTVELTFYAWIFLLYLIRQLDKIDWLLAGFTVLSVLTSLGELQIPYTVHVLTIGEYSCYFLAGVSFFRLTQGGGRLRSYFFVAVSLAAAGLLLETDRFFAMFVVYCIFHAAVSGYMTFIRQPVFVYLGVISYTLYLVHQNIGYVIMNEVYEQGGNSVIAITAAIAASLALAAAIHHFVEKPAQSQIRSFYKQSQEKAS